MQAQNKLFNIQKIIISLYSWTKKVDFNDSCLKHSHFKRVIQKYKM